MNFFEKQDAGMQLAKLAWRSSRLGGLLYENIG